MRVERRSVIAVILLSIFTCGIYSLYLYYALSSDLNRLKGQTVNDPAIDLLLCIFTCGIYNVYWQYKVAKQVESLQAELGMRIASISILCPILQLFSLGFVGKAILVSEINNCINEM